MLVQPGWGPSLLSTRRTPAPSSALRTFQTTTDMPVYGQLPVSHLPHHARDGSGSTRRNAAFGLKRAPCIVLWT